VLLCCPFKPRTFVSLVDLVQVRSLENAGSQSKLPAPIQELVKMVFDIESMKKAMLEFEVGTGAMMTSWISASHLV